MLINDNFDFLVARLEKFGLNPDHWRLKKLGPTDFMIIHRKDRKFRLIGIVEGLDCSDWLHVCYLF